MVAKSHLGQFRRHWDDAAAMRLRRIAQMFKQLIVDPGGALKTLILVLDLAGTFVFALSGALAGVKRKLDFFGIMVLSFAAANSGGIARDVLIGATPPAAISDWRYLLAALCAGMMTFFWHSTIERLRDSVLVFDAAGLALFAVAGTQKALAFNLNPIMAAVLGMLTGIGGGIVRDVLLREVPEVLRAEIYALAALAGALVIVLGHLLSLPTATVTVVGALLCFAIRILALRRNWQLPSAASWERRKRQRSSRRDNW
jgi:uncharacterized membrane protein YeiH